MLKPGDYAVVCRQVDQQEIAKLKVVSVDTATVVVVDPDGIQSRYEWNGAHFIKDDDSGDFLGSAPAPLNEAAPPSS